MEHNENNCKVGTLDKLIKLAKLIPYEDAVKLHKHVVVNALYSSTLLSTYEVIRVQELYNNHKVYVEAVTGYIVPTDIVEWVQEYTQDTLDVLHTYKVLLESTEGLLECTTSLTIPEAFKEPTEAPMVLNEPLGVISPMPFMLPFVMTKSMFSKLCVQKHRTHYVKLVLDPKKYPELSFRFFYESEDNKHQEGKWVLKDHNKKVSIEVTKEFIEKHFEDVVGAFEVIGRLSPKKGYMKIIKNLHTKEIVEIKE